MKTENGRTYPVGEIIDQSHLPGVLDRLSDFSFELLSVEALSEKEER